MDDDERELLPGLSFCGSCLVFPSGGHLQRGRALIPVATMDSALNESRNKDGTPLPVSVIRFSPVYSQGDFQTMTPLGQPLLNPQRNPGEIADKVRAGA